MSLYEYVGSAPISHLDPAGLEWDIAKYPTLGEATATATEGDTLAGLAVQLGLNEKEFPLWARGAVRMQMGATWHVHNFPRSLVTPDNLSEKVCPGEKVKVPNTIVFIYHKDVADAEWYDTSIFRLLKNVLDAAAEQKEAEGHLVLKVEYQDRNHTPLQQWFSNPRLLELWYAGHGGKEDPDQVASGLIESRKGSSLYPGRYAHHQLRRLVLFGCNTAVPEGHYSFNQQDVNQRSFDQTRAGGRTNVSSWELNVSPNGVFVGVEGEASFWNVVERTVVRFHGADYSEQEAERMGERIDEWGRDSRGRYRLKDGTWRPW